MDRRFHIIITSEKGQARTFAIPKNTLKNIVRTVGSLFLLGLMAAITYPLVTYYMAKNADSQASLASVTPVKGPPKITDVYSELTQRSRTIESILSTLDIQTPPAASGKDSGGPFISLNGTNKYQDLIGKVDRELSAIRPLPLGYPTRTTGIASTFGSRTDPINGEAAFHEGIDLRGIPGTLVKATAEGKVDEEGYSDDYGWFVLIKHDNDFSTMYAHNQKVLIKQGEHVDRGETIALLGNTGRSTGPHLHYEIRHHNRPINPAKFMNISKLLAENVG